MATDLPNDSTTRLTIDDFSETYEPEPIFIPLRDVIDDVVGPLTHTELGRVGADTLAWSGVDAAGRVRSGTMRLRVEDDAKSITLAWDVDVDDG